ncbi:MAG: extensin family protein [Paracoccaceae bacterium]
MRPSWLLALSLAFAAGVVQADGLNRSPIPHPRPVVLTIVPAAIAPIASNDAPTLRPRPRPAVVASIDPATAEPPAAVVVLAADAIAPTLHPKPRPQELATDGEPRRRKGLGALFNAGAVRTQPGAESVLPKKGSVCGDRAIRGEAIAPIVGKIRGCGVPDAVRVTSVDGVKLSMAATIDCPTAIALKQWVHEALKPAFGRTKVVALQVAGHYVCRPRNNVRGNKISEHGHGKAIDISGITLADGSTVTVAGNWRRGNGKPMKVAYKAACGIFGTTLGPGSDGYHEDHMHFDTASYRSGAYCR